ncbi:CDP-diacylglycerol-glycerol-3-phosphate 3-phosphatidyltransferase [Trema orientale]|uniref:CDP-diacylglycerol-glycerol-3-phosphate 3-phosphatidyltransferase n=1 Tax=Trema orientale TaxID=63057 RepID=A0A2P5BY77_TREOI|nr:CDP-diacylglycerol-glycerol-3-phosphate 3-phosphatidyltransferase [Trema orientale]
MESNGSYETSWADQWDTNEPKPAPVYETRTLGGRPKGKYSKKMEDGLGKTKAAASRGIMRVKIGATIGARWIKAKYHKTTRKH